MEVKEPEKLTYTINHVPSESTNITVCDSNATNEIALALSKAQGEFKEIKKNRTAGSGNFKYDYADLASIISATQQALTKYELCISQIITYEGGLPYLKTQLLHSSGQKLESKIQISIDPKPQETGKTMTYYRRYSISSILNVSSDDDTDANGVINKPVQTRSISEAQLKRLFAIASKHKWTPENVEHICKRYLKLESRKDLNQEQYEKLINYIQKMSFDSALEYIEALKKK